MVAALELVRASRIGGCSEILHRTEAETACISSLSTLRQSTKAGIPSGKERKLFLI